eukprot:8625739-Ditylum_brightwellii.AAC.1
MDENFSPSWVSCLNEPMMFWVSKYICPGFMVVPRKSWPFGNEWHSIDGGNSKIIYCLELVKGKDEPREKPCPQYIEKEKT